jgi:hypothetical protein
MTDKQKEIIEVLFKNAKNVPFGMASVELKIHAGKCVGVTFTTSENIKQKEDGDGVLE